MARTPLPEDREVLGVLLGQVIQFLGIAEPFYEKILRQQLMILRALEDPAFLCEYESFAGHLQEEITRAGAALELPSKLLFRYLEEVEGGDQDEVAEDQQFGRSADIGTELADQYCKISFAVRTMNVELEPYRRLSDRILVKPAEIPPQGPGSLPRLRVDVANEVVVFDGIGYKVGEVLATFFQALEQAAGGWVSSPKMRANYPILEGVRLDRDRKKLPRILDQLIESEPGRGRGYLLRIDPPA